MTVADIIILLIVAGLVVLALVSTKKHFGGKGGCCGGGCSGSCSSCGCSCSVASSDKTPNPNK